MLLEEILPSEQKRSRSFHDSRPESAPTADINFFSFLLDRPAFSADTSRGATATSMLAQASEHLNKSTDELSKNLKALGKNNSIDAVHKYTAQLSNTLLTSHVLVKSLGKTAQCIDKICNLQ